MDRFGEALLRLLLCLVWFGFGLIVCLLGSVWFGLLGLLWFVCLFAWFSFGLVWFGFGLIVGLLGSVWFGLLGLVWLFLHSLPESQRTSPLRGEYDGSQVTTL